MFEVRTYRFSIIVPVYNSKTFLRECIESLSIQSFDDFEVIFVNDGSTDGSGEICENFIHSFSQMNIKVYHQKNLGQIQARYNGIKHAKGEYCLFLDSDDTFSVDTLHVISEVIDRFSSDCIIFNGQRWLNDEKFPFWPEYTDEVTLFTGKELKRIQYDLIFTRRFNNLAFKAIKTTILKESLVYNDVSYIREEEDLMMQLPMFDRIKSVVYLPQLLYNYRLNPTSVTTHYNKFRFPAKVYVLNERLKYSLLWGINGFAEQRLKLIVQCVKRTLFLLKNVAYDKSLVISEIKSIRMHNDFHDLYFVRKQLNLDFVSKFFILLIYNKCYLLLYLIVIVCRLLFGGNKSVNTVLKKSYNSSTLCG